MKTSKNFNLSLSLVSLFFLLAMSCSLWAQQSLLILAPDEFIPALQPLKEFKESTGRSTYLVGLSQVYNNYTGTDEPEQIKYCIADYEQNCDIENVMLVGDVDKFPVRWRWFGRWMPHDLQPFHYHRGQWEVHDGEYYQLMFPLPTGVEKSGWFRSWIDITSEANYASQYTVEVDCTLLGGDPTARKVWIFLADADLHIGLPEHELFLCVEIAPTYLGVRHCGVLDKVAATFNDGSTYHVKAQLTQNQVQVWIDGSHYITTNLEPAKCVQPGKVGIGTRMCQAKFDDFTVKTLSGTTVLSEDFSGIPNGTRPANWADAPHSSDRSWEASDLYYADLYKNGDRSRFDNWNAYTANGHDLLYGEIEWDIPIYCPGCVINNDQIDYLPDVNVGRVPASTEEEVSLYVSKIIHYETNTHVNDAWFKRAVLLVGNSDGEGTNNKIETYLKSQSFQVQNRKWTGDLQNLSDLARKQVAIDAFNNGAGLINFLGHGDQWTWGGVNFRCSDIQGALTNSSMLPVVLAGACLTGKFTPSIPAEEYRDIYNTLHPGMSECTRFPGPPDTMFAPPMSLQPKEPDGNESMAEWFLFRGGPSKSGGAIAYLGERTVGRGGLSDDLSREFFTSYVKGITLGDMWRKMIEEYYDAHKLYESTTWMHDPKDMGIGHTFDEPEKFILFGDPSLVIGGLNIKSIPTETSDVTHPISNNIATDAIDSAIDGHRVVWAEKKYDDYDIFMYDLETCITTCITYKIPGDQRCPDISGDKIVWHDKRNGNWDIIGWDLIRSEEFEVSTNPLIDETEPVISGNRVAWQECNSATGWDISYKDLDTGTVTPVCHSSGHQFHCDIDGDIIVWEDWRTVNDSDIYYYNCCTKTTEVVEIQTGNQKQPAISYPWIVWFSDDTVNGKWGIYGTNLADPTLPSVVMLVDEANSDKVYPAIHGNKIVWYDNRNNNWDIYGGDLDVHTIFPIATQAVNEQRPMISDNFVVWNSGVGTGVCNVLGKSLGILPWKKASPIDFEYYLPDLTAIVNQYEGVVFSAPGYSDSPRISKKDAATSSGQYALEGVGGASITSKLRMDFTLNQIEVSFTLGNAGKSTIFVYDDRGNLIMTKLREVRDDSVYYDVNLKSAKRNIKSVEIHSGSGLTLLIDDLRFDKSPFSADINQDFRVNMLDLAMFSEQWLSIGVQDPYQGQPATVPSRIEAEDFDRGGQGIGCHDMTPYDNIGEEYRLQEPADIQTTSDTGGGYNVGWMEADEWLAYTVDIDSAASYDVLVRVASPVSGSTLSVLCDDTLVTTFNVPLTGAWQAWQTIQQNVILPAGTHTIKLKVGAGDAYRFNVNWIEFVKK